LILAGCYPASTGSNVAPDPKDCSLITRDPTSGKIQHFLDVEQNAGSLVTSGIDVVLRYALPTAIGRFRFWIDSNYLITQNLVLPSGKVIHSARNYDLNVFSAVLGVTPRLRFNTGIDYDRGPFTTGVVARYIGGFDECAPPSGSTSGGRGLCTDHNVDPNTGVPYPLHRVASYVAFDIYASYALKSSLGTTSFTAGVRNVFDAIPPAVYNSFLTYADPSYDFVGRYLWGRIVHKF
jgi:iron complex outermembrane recepter protein